MIKSKMIYAIATVFLVLGFVLGIIASISFHLAGLLAVWFSSGLISLSWFVIGTLLEHFEKVRNFNRILLDEIRLMHDERKCSSPIASSEAVDNPVRVGPQFDETGKMI